MTAILRSWREASTLILVARCSDIVLPTFIPPGKKRFERPRRGASSEDNHVDQNPSKVLLLERSSQSEFTPSAFVFPGGVADDHDFSADWHDLFRSSGKNYQKIKSIFERTGEPRSPMFYRKRDLQFSGLPSDFAFRISAIRETFEESGVLLAQQFSDIKIKDTHEVGTNLGYVCKDVIPENELPGWRKAVHENPAKFLEMCQTFKILPCVWSLNEWSNWLTPVSEGEKTHRFDTAFYLAALEDIPESVSDDGEIISSRWLTPRKAVSLYKKKEMRLVPPTLYELSRLDNFQNFDQICQYIMTRADRRPSRWMPVFTHATDALLIIYPGDDMYPEKVDPETVSQMPSLEKSADELARSCVHINRMKLQDGVFTIQCNIMYRDSHMLPTTIFSNVDNDMDYYSEDEEIITRRY